MAEEFSTVQFGEGRISWSELIAPRLIQDGFQNPLSGIDYSSIVLQVLEMGVGPSGSSVIVEF